MNQPANVRETLIALVRTVVPVAVGYVLAWLAQLGLPLPEDATSLISLLLTTLFTAAYYALIRWLSSKWRVVGWLLGYPTDPTYEPKHGDDV